MLKLNQQTTYAVVKVNEVEILCSEEKGKKFIPVKPICEALGIASNAQIEKIKSHPILGSTDMLSISVGSDKKNREMFCLPLKYIFGWLFTINPDNVKESARDDLIKYQTKCYNAVYECFIEKSDFYSEKDKQKLQLQVLLLEKKEAVKEVKDCIDIIDKITFTDWKADKQQLYFAFKEEEGVNDGR